MTRAVVSLALAWATAIAPFAAPLSAQPLARENKPLPAHAVARLDPSQSKLYGTMWSLVFAPDGKTLALGSQTGSVCLWSPEGKTAVRRFGGHEGGAYATWFSPDGKRLASVGGEGTLRWWDLATGDELKCFGTPRKDTYDAQSVYTAAFTADGKIAVLGGWDGHIRVWDTGTGKQLHRWKASGFVEVAVSRDGKRVADPHQVWDITGKSVAKLERLGTSRGFPAFSADGTLLAGMAWGPEVFLWKPTTGKLWAQLKVKQKLGSAVAFSPDGQTLATAEEGGPIRLWEMRTRQERRVLSGHADPVYALAFSPDGRRLASGDREAVALLWNTFGLADKKVPALQECWSDLGNADAGRAYRAIEGLVAHEQKSVDLLGEHLQPVPTLTDEKVKELLADLDNRQFCVREAASSRLRLLYDLAESPLRKALAAQQTPEATRRIKALLEAIEDLSSAPEQLRAERAVELLEQIASQSARKLLQRLAEGAPQARLTQQAQGALKRLAR